MDVFDLVAKIRLDDSEYEQGVGKAKGTFSSLASGVGKGLATVAKVGAAAVTAAATGVAALTKMGVEGYAQYEQLVGGVETLFKESQNIVMGYAENAYKTAGMSANQYMETVTSFSASLIQSLDGDTAKAAQVGNMAITDMSDNANKMGTSIEMIQNAYQGFAKQNYTMLDNLKLGYGGTKEEMQRLIDDANKVKKANGEMANLSIDSFADVTEAIHIMQTEMGITGTTAREAATTIEGSLAMMKGAWQNLVVGMADENANMEVLINNFVDSTATAAENLLPRISQTLAGIGDLITGLAPVIGQALPMLVESVLPSLLSAGVSLATSIVQGVISALPALYTALVDAVQLILVEVFGVSEQKAGEFADGMKSAFGKVQEGFSAMVESAQTEGTFLNEVWVNLQEMGQAFGDLLTAVWEAISSLFTECVEQINTDGTILNQVWSGIQDAILFCQEVIIAALDIITGAFTGFVEQINTDGTWLNETWTAIQEAVQAWMDYMSALFDAVSAAFSWCVEQIKTEGTWLNTVWKNIKAVASAVWEQIKNVIKTAIDILKNTFKLFTSVLQGDWSGAWDAIKNIASAAWEGIKNTFSNAVELLKNLVVNAWDHIKSVTTSVWDGIKSAISTAWDSVKSVVSGAIDNVKSSISTGLETAKSTVSTVLGTIESKFSTIFENAKSIVLGAIEAIKGAFDFEWSLPELKLPHISVSGGVAPYGIGGKGSLPVFSIEWYKKAYDNAMVLSSPTIFGYSNGKFLGGGDGNGNEIVAGESYLMKLIGRVVAEQNGQIAGLLAALLEATVDGNGEMVRALKAGQVITVNERELGRVVRGFA